MSIPIIVIIALLLAYIKYSFYIHSPVDKNDNRSISFQVKKGQSVKEIANNLEKKKLIKSSYSFYLYAKLNHLGENIIAGRFILTKTMNTPDILKSLSNPAKAEYILTVQEGLTIKDIDEKLVELDLIQAGEFLKAVKNFNSWGNYSFLDKNTLSKLALPLEGYLYPDTYFLDSENFTPESVITIMLNNFEKKFAKLQPQIKRHTIQQIITMASIIENEVRSTPDRKTVSGILWKRLESGWSLGADATLLYITDDRKIDSKDLALNSPYNTRKNLGLPPGPISNPSINSIEAAMFPTSSDYWFYLTTLDTGKVIYAKSNEEHNANRVKYLN